MSVVFHWISSPHGSLGLAHHRYAYCELSDTNTQTLSGPLTLIRSLWCLEGQMGVVAIRAPGLTPLPIAGWLALGYEALLYPFEIMLCLPIGKHRNGHVIGTWLCTPMGRKASVSPSGYSFCFKVISFGCCAIFVRCLGCCAIFVIWCICRENWCVGNNGTHDKKYV